MKSGKELLELLTTGLAKAAETHTNTTLGNRHSYLGISDLAHGLSCPRAVLATKLQEQPEPMPLQNLIQTRRGHWLEHGIEEALSATGQHFMSQLEINIVYQNTPIKAHLDLVLPDQNTQTVTVLELKSLALMRDTIYSSHEAQLYGQIGLLEKFYSQPVFNLGGQSRLCTFPELVKNHLGLSLPSLASSISIQGFVLTVSPKEAKPFGPYQPNSAILESLLSCGAVIWQTLKSIKNGSHSLAEVPCQEGFSPLCDYCRFNRDCQKFQGSSYPELEPELIHLVTLKDQKARLESEIKDREDQLKALATLTGRKGQWLNTGHYRFKVSQQQGRITLNSDLVKEKLNQLGEVDESQVTAILASSQKIGKPFEKLQLSPVN